MKTSYARRNYLLLHDDGRVHYPMSKFLTAKYDNPHTRELAAQALRVFYRFLEAHRIELITRALEGSCLSYHEVTLLIGLCYRPLAEVELLSDRKVVLITSAKAVEGPEELPNAVEPNTVRQRLGYIAGYLKFYREAILDGHIRLSATRTDLQNSYERTREQLIEAVSGTKQNHHLNIQSLPSDRFLELIRAIFLEPERLFLTPGGKVSSTTFRDRAMALLACECLRPGAIGNIGRADFRLAGGYLVVKDNRRRRNGRTTTGTPVLKLGQSTRINSASETMIRLYPFTVEAIQDYLKQERDAVQSKHLRNRSEGMLFLNQTGSPIKHRSSLTSMFSRLGQRLRAIGLLDVGNDPQFFDKQQYDFYAYVLRHSAASLFLQVNGQSEKVFDDMRLRFGWTADSKMPLIYGARAMSDAANVNLDEFYQSMIREKNSKKEGRR